MKISQFRPAILLVLLLHVSSFGVHVKAVQGEPTDSKSNAKDTKDGANAEAIKKAVNDAKILTGKTTTEMQKAVQHIIDKSKEDILRFRSASEAKYQAVENVERAKEAIKEADASLKAAQAEADKPDASEGAKKALNDAKEEKTTMDNVFKDANNSLLKYSAEFEIANKAAKAAEDAVRVAEGTFDDAKRAAYEITNALEKGESPEKAWKALGDAQAALEALTGAAKPDKVVKSTVVSGDGVGDVTVRVSNPKGPNIGIPETNGPNHGQPNQGKPDTATPKTKTDKTVKSPVNSATAISSTIPAVLITSVVFIYLYNW